MIAARLPVSARPASRLRLYRRRLACGLARFARIPAPSHLRFASEQTRRLHRLHDGMARTPQGRTFSADPFMERGIEAMQIAGLNRYALVICVAAAMLAGCGGSPPPISPWPAGVRAERTHMRPAYGVLYSFKGGHDGANPFAGLLKVKGTLYGTTLGGGTNNDGTVFAITTPGKETVLHSFSTTGKDGATPFASLVDVKGILYGTTVGGGTYGGGGGTVFAITKSGMETVLHSFSTTSKDGGAPYASLVDVKGILYGTTVDGGGKGCLSIGVGPSSQLRRPARKPCSTVLAARGTATTRMRASSTSKARCTAQPCMAESAIVLPVAERSSRSQHPARKPCSTASAARRETAQIRMRASSTSRARSTARPFLAAAGKGANPLFNGCGTVFSITTSGKETVLHRFAGGSGDGENPSASLVDVKGTLYGTTLGGGTYDDGTVFSITTTDGETVLHSFGGEPDGRSPYAGLINVKGMLYGTTKLGGANDGGTVFSLSP